MARPSQNQDQALLQAGRQLYPQFGCAGLSVRMLAQQAGVNIGMFHYHFKSKELFIQHLLQDWYEQMFAQLQLEVAGEAETLEKLRHAILLIARLMREHGDWFGRVWQEAGQGQTVALSFLQRNGKRHVQVLLGLIQLAIAQKQLPALPPVQLMTYLMGAVVSPMFMAPRVIQLGVAPVELQQALNSSVVSDQGIQQRLELALAGLTSALSQQCRQESRP